MEARILLFDIENAPSLGYFYDMSKEYNIIEIVEHSYMLSFAYKWLHEKRIHVRALPDYPTYKDQPKDDRLLVSELADLLEKADFVVAHNGDRFDLTVTNTRLIANGLGPVPPLKTIDTLKIARQKFKFPSNRLDALGNYLDVGRKKAHHGAQTWLGCMRGNMKDWRTMRAYNAQDVALLERVYLKIRPYGRHPNVNHTTRRISACPVCGSSNLIKKGHVYTATTEAQRYLCLECGKWSNDKSEKIGSRITIR